MQVTDCNSGGFLATVRHVYNCHGVHGFWRGNGLSVLKSSPEFAIKFSVYDYVKRQLMTRRDDGHLKGRDRFVAGAFAGVCGQTFLYPLEVRDKREFPIIVCSLRKPIFNIRISFYHVGNNVFYSSNFHLFILFSA